jgi:hypothetical protein
MTSNLEHQLELIKDVKRFCTELGMLENDAYTKLIDDKFYYALFASPKNKVKKYFDNIEGSISFDNKNDCYTESERLKKLDLDTAVLKCDTALDIDLKNNKIRNMPQLTQSFMDNIDIEIVAGIAHENIHIYRAQNNIRMNLYIEEAVACNLQYQIAEQYYANSEIMLKEVKKGSDYYSKYFKWCKETHSKLKKAYEIDLISGRNILDKAKKEYLKEFHRGEDINNAFFVAYNYYAKYYESVKKILQNKNPKNVLNQIAKADREITTIAELKRIIR